MKKYMLLFLIVGTSLITNAQELADYKYIIVPAKFDFQKEPGQYEMNALAKFLFQKYGFNAFISTEELPNDYNASSCNSLVMTVKESGFLSTKLTYQLSDCRGQVVYTSPEGKSKIKEFKPAYDEAIREAMMGLEELGYTYSDEIFAVAETPKEDTEEDVMTTVRRDRMPKSKNDELKTSRMDKMPKRIEDKTVIVQAVPKPQVTPKPKVKKEVAQQEMPNEEPAAVAPKKIPEDKPMETTISSMSSAQFYKSVDGSYSLQAKDQGFDLYEGGQKIGSAKKTSGNTYLVSSSDFVGVGTLNGDTFTIEREIKGVQGLVKMIFKSANQ